MLKAKQSLWPDDSPWQAMDARPGVDFPGQEASARLPLAGSVGWLLRALSDLASHMLMASKPHILLHSKSPGRDRLPGSFLSLP